MGVTLEFNSSSFSPSLPVSHYLNTNTRLTVLTPPQPLKITGNSYASTHRKGRIRAIGTQPQTDTTTPLEDPPTVKLAFVSVSRMIQTVNVELHTIEH